MAWASKLSSLALVSGAMGARMKRQQRQTQNAIFIAGTPVLNYNRAYEGHANLAEMSEDEIAALNQDWLLFMQPGVADAEINRLCKMAKCVREGHPEEGGVSYLEVHTTESDLASIIHSAKGSVKFVEPDFDVQMIPEMDEPQGASWGLDRVRASARSSRGEGVSVYVLDTGIRATHNDFDGRVVPALDLTEGGLLECNGDLNCAKDAQGHGTHCAGSAAGKTYGVAPKATIRTVKVLSDSGSGAWSWSYDALDWLATKGERPAVASMSLGGQGVLAGMKDSVDAAVNAGVTVVVAGGNSNSDACRFSPAYVPSAITVGSTTRYDSRSSFSNYGPCTNIWAPGSDITSASHRSDSGSRSLSGTSMACPHVSGAVALVLERNTDFKSPAVLAKLVKEAFKDELRGLKNGDTNVLLNAGAL